MECMSKLGHKIVEDNDVRTMVCYINRQQDLEKKSDYKEEVTGKGGYVEKWICVTSCLICHIY